MSPLTLASLQVKFIPEAEMQDRMAILCCNLKPSKMRGILSEAMVMCASTPDKVGISLALSFTLMSRWKSWPLPLALSPGM